MKLTFDTLHVEVYEDCIVIRDDDHCVIAFLSEETVDAIIQAWLELHPKIRIKNRHEV